MEMGGRGRKEEVLKALNMEEISYYTHILLSVPE